MTSKERLLNAIKGKEVDKMPWSPFLAYWWDFQDKSIQDKGQVSFMQEIGADPLLRGFHGLIDIEYSRCCIRKYTKGDKRYTIYETPVGELTAVEHYVEDGNTWFVVGHPVKTEEDFKVLAHISEGIRLKPNYTKFNEDHTRLGDGGLYLPTIGVYGKTSFQSLLEYWVGTEELIYALMDYPETVEMCLQAMRKQSTESAKICVNSDAEGFIFWEDSSTTNLSPSMFEEYTVPEINEWGEIIHDAGKVLVHHACGHIKDLIPSMNTEKVDMIESISPPPTGNMEIWDAANELKETIGVIGGIEPTKLLSLGEADFEEYITNIITKMKSHKRYILANSDSCPPGVERYKFEMISQLVKKL